jgi:Tfp pilus assembly protein PilX
MSKLPSPRHGEQGSAYIVVLLALVVLTIIGLSLVMVTQTEVQLGSNERTISRTFFAADSGMDVATARHLLENDDRSLTFIQNASGLGGQNIADQVQLSKITVLSTAPCDFCPVNANGQQYVNANTSVSATARRVGWNGSAPPPLPPAAGVTVFSQSQVIAEIRFTNQQMPSVDSIRTP